MATVVKGIANHDAVDFDETWGSLAASLGEIHTKNASTLSFEQLYRNAYKLVLRKKGELLYDKVLEQEGQWLAAHVRPNILAVMSPALAIMTAGENANEVRAAGETFMLVLKEAWQDHIVSMKMITDVLMYLDRVYCSENRRPLIFVAGMMSFRDLILHYCDQPQSSGPSAVTIGQVLTLTILGQIEMERNGEVVDRNLIRSCCYMLEGLYEGASEDENGRLYLTEFEPQFLAESRRFYRQEGQILVRDSDAGTFCRRTTQRLGEEADRCRSTLSILSLDKIKLVIDESLIKPYIYEVTYMPGSGVACMCDNDRFVELEMIYQLISQIDAKKVELQHAVQKRIVSIGHEVNAAAQQFAQAPPPTAASTGKGEPAEKAGIDGRPPTERPLNQQTAAAIKWVDDILQLRDKYESIHERSFNRDQDMQVAITRSLAEIINAFDRSSEYLSLFFDENMKKGIKGKTEHEVDTLLDKGITLLRYVQDKDMFERYYKKHLSRRLLMKRSVSMDAERQMIGKMKLEVGNTFTQRIEAMFKDIAVSEDLTSSYKQKAKDLEDTDEKKRAELDVNVLTSTMWPLDAMTTTDVGKQPPPSCIFPPSIARVMQSFEKFYLGKHSGRKLSWQAGMGTADLRAYFPKSKGTIKTRELNVSTYAMVILLLFNDLPAGASLTCEEIEARTNIPIHDLTRNLQSLAVAPKTRVLLKDPMSKDVKPSDRFTFNESFHSPFNKIKIGVVSNANRVEGSEERKETEKKTNEARAGIIEAAIVRIMKQRKSLGHQNLVAEVISQLNARFKPDVGMVKKRIESLIEREYLERSDDVERPSYNYLA